MTFLMQRPTDVYRSAGDSALQALDWARYSTHVAVQIRTNFDDSSAKHIRKHLPHTWECVKSLIANVTLPARDKAFIFFAADDAGLRPAARQHLSAFGDVKYHSAPIVHTSKVRGHRIGAGMIEFYGMSQVRASALHKAHPYQARHQPATDVPPKAGALLWAGSTCRGASSSAKAA